MLFSLPFHSLIPNEIGSILLITSSLFTKWLSTYTCRHRYWRCYFSFFVSISSCSYLLAWWVNYWELYMGIEDWMFITRYKLGFIGTLCMIYFCECSNMSGMEINFINWSLLSRIKAWNPDLTYIFINSSKSKKTFGHFKP